MVLRKKILIGLLVGSIIFLLIAILINAKRSATSLNRIKSQKAQQLKANQGKVIEVPVPVKIKKK